MTEAARQFWTLVMATATDPSAAAREVLGLPLSREVLWLSLGLASVLSVLSLAALELAAPAASVEPGTVQVTPFALVIVFMATLLITAFALYLTGLAMGGSGSFEASLASVIWLQLCLIVLQMGQAALALLSPALGALVGMAGLVLLVWAMTHFVKVFHGFGGTGRALSVVVLAFVGTGVGLAVILTMIGATTVAATAMGGL